LSYYLISGTYESYFLTGYTALTLVLIYDCISGTYESRWRLYSGDTVFGHGVFCKVNVSDQFLFPYNPNSQLQLSQQISHFMDIYQKVGGGLQYCAVLANDSVPQGCGDVKPAGRIFASVGL
jgi:hypothetical protein